MSPRHRRPDGREIGSRRSGVNARRRRWGPREFLALGGHSIAGWFKMLSRPQDILPYEIGPIEDLSGRRTILALCAKADGAIRHAEYGADEEVAGPAAFALCPRHALARADSTGRHSSRICRRIFRPGAARGRLVRRKNRRAASIPDIAIAILSLGPASCRDTRLTIVGFCVGGLLHSSGLSVGGRGFGFMRGFD